MKRAGKRKKFFMGLLLKGVRSRVSVPEFLRRLSSKLLDSVFPLYYNTFWKLSNYQEKEVFKIHTKSMFRPFKISRGAAD
jgi:hypothetical protein